MEKHFIRAGEARTTAESFVPAPYLRRTFTLGFKPREATLRIGAFGLYRLFVNGKELTKGILAPYISNPEDMIAVDTYDLSGILTEGGNAIGVILGNGFGNLFDTSFWDFDKIRWNAAPAVTLELTAANGAESFSLVSDESFRTHPSPLRFDSIRCGEVYDARCEVEGWSEPDFDDSLWEFALPAPYRTGELIPAPANPIRVYATEKPRKIIPYEKGYIYDFGVNSAGLCRLHLENSSAGERVSMVFFEDMRTGVPSFLSCRFKESSDKFYFDHIQKDVYIAAGRGVEDWMPSFTYHGFRYVLVEGISPEEATESLLTFERLSSAATPKAGFRCSDARVTAAFDAAVNSDLSNFYYFPTDCPHREKHGWTGDASASAERMTVFYDVEDELSLWLKQIRMAQDADGNLPGIVPTGGWGFAWGNGPAWDSILFRLPYVLWRYRGRTDVVTDTADAMMRYFDFVQSKRSADGTMDFGLGDWCPVCGKAGDYLTPRPLVSTLYVMEMAREAEEMLGAVGLTEKSRRAAAFYDDLRHTVRRVYLHEDTCVLGDGSQSGQALGLAFGLFEESEKERAFAALLRLIDARGGMFEGGYLGRRVIYDILTDFGEGERAYRMFTGDTIASECYYTDHGFTSMPEMLHGADVYVGSHNHHFQGDGARWLLYRVGGLHVLSYNHAVIEPIFPEGLASASCFAELEGGRVEVSWKNEGGKKLLRVTCPEGVALELRVPGDVAVERVCTCSL